MKIAIIHYWLVGMRGGEKVLESICELYPNADIFTHVIDPDKISNKLKQHKIETTFINKLPFAKRYYQKYLPLMPLALEQLDLSEYDLIISTESGPAKGVITRPDATHICYCHTPMRYAWDMYHEYLRQQNFFTRMMMRPLLHYIRLWDFQSAARVDHFIANSNYVSKRINKFYRREATVIHPPVDVDTFTPSTQAKEDYYLLLGQLVRYKKADLAVQAFTKLNKKLLVIGVGEQQKELENMAGENIEFLGWQEQSVIRHHLQHCKALIFPGVEDFGIVPLEAMACGTPVIAYGAGGALETVVDNETGLLFNEQSVSGLIAAIKRFENRAEKFDSLTLQAHAQAFSSTRFKDEFLNFVDYACKTN